MTTRTCLRLLSLSLLLTSCVHGPLWQGNLNPAEVAIPARPPGGMSGSEFAKILLPLATEARERAILNELRRGNIPDFLRNLQPVNLSLRSSKGENHAATVWVTPDYLAIGNDSDFIRVPMNPMTAQRVADHYGFVLPTKKLVDEIYRQANTKLRPESLPPSDRMVNSDYYIKHNDMIERQLSPLGQGQLTAGHKKDIVVTNRLQEVRGRVAIYGWHRDPLNPIQPLSTIHANTYADYSHGVRLVHGMMRVDGEMIPVAEVLQDQRLAPLLSDEGVIRVTRAVTDCN